MSQLKFYLFEIISPHLIFSQEFGTFMNFLEFRLDAGLFFPSENAPTGTHFPYARSKIWSLIEILHAAFFRLVIPPTHIGPSLLVFFFLCISPTVNPPFLSLIVCSISHFSARPPVSFDPHFSISLKRLSSVAVPVLYSLSFLGKKIFRRTVMFSLE